MKFEVLIDKQYEDLLINLVDYKDLVETDEGIITCYYVDLDDMFDLQIFHNKVVSLTKLDCELIFDFNNGYQNYIITIKI